jgi:SAM-dependent methyltransferase
MAITCPTGFDVDRLRADVSTVYERVAEAPDGDFHFHRGPEYAARLLGYDADELASLPDGATRSFAGVGNPHRLGPVHPGETVMDIGSGAGTDLLLAARRVAPEGRAIGVDMTRAMRERARVNAIEAGLADVVEIREGLAEALPADDASVDVVISNGVLNLAVDKRQAFTEILRVLKPGGRMMLADVVVERELSLGARSNPDLWAA